jgi:hypothetical protein
VIKLKAVKGQIDLAEHSAAATLVELADTLEAFVAARGHTKLGCRMCGECCGYAPVLGLDMTMLSRREGLSLKDWADLRVSPPVFPDLAARHKGIEELRRQTGLPEREATVLYEFNNSEPMTFKPGESGGCLYQRGNLCSDFSRRAFICRLYLCSFGDELQALEEMVACQGTWHAWSLLGAVPEELIRHNPFIGAESFNDLLVKDFEFGMEGALIELFIYF